MIIHLVNPNSTDTMTQLAKESALAVVSCGTRIIVTTCRDTPSSIEGHVDEALAVPAMLRAIREAELAGAQAHVIACFDDVGLGAAREVASGPVLALCQSALQVAATIAAKSAIVTTLPRSVAIIEHLVLRYGMGNHCRRVSAVDIPVLALENGGDEVFHRIVTVAEKSRDLDGAEAIILGCAGMADLPTRLAQRLGIPVIDGVAAATTLAEAMLRGRFSTSKSISYAAPFSKVGGWA